MSSASSSSNTCPRPGCGKAAPLKCGSCKCVDYCGRDCQKSTWPKHKQLCKAVISSNSSSSCLILDGMGALGSGDINTKPILSELMSRHNMPVSVVHLDDGFVTPQQIATALDKGNFSACIILGWGSGDEDVGLDFASSQTFQEGLVSWVKQGGRLMVQGERISHAAGDWPEWFGFHWKSCDYCRTTHALNTSHLFQEAAAAHPTMDVKACLVNHVDPQDNLYGPPDGAVTHSLGPGFGGNAVAAGQSAFTLAKYGDGTVSYFGDVNAEKVTIETVGIIIGTGRSGSS